MTAAGTGQLESISTSAGLYVHVPFCAIVCPYCDFAVRTGNAPRRRKYTASLGTELDRIDDWPHRIDTIYFGGGTPSLIESADLRAVLDHIEDRLDLAADAIISLEANPEDISADGCQSWRDLGVTTVSLGIQALSDVRLRFLGRRHDAAAARHSVATAQTAGFGCVAVDLIYGLPDDTAAAWQAELDAAIALQPDHLSCYQLSVHDGTRFGKQRDRGTLRELPDEGQAELFEFTHRHLAAHGYQAYEVSNFARTPSHRSRHNQKYWQHQPYLGIGPAAHSFDGSSRWWNERRLDDWEERLARGERPIAGRERLTKRDRALETVMLGLRTTAGVDLAQFEQRFGFDLVARNRTAVSHLVDQELAVATDSHLHLTLPGLAIADTLTARLEVEP